MISSAAAGEDDGWRRHGSPEFQDLANGDEEDHPEYYQKEEQEQPPRREDQDLFFARMIGNLLDAKLGNLEKRLQTRQELLFEALREELFSAVGNNNAATTLRGFSGDDDLVASSGCRRSNGWGCAGGGAVLPVAASAGEVLTEGPWHSSLDHRVPREGVQVAAARDLKKKDGSLVWPQNSSRSSRVL